MLTYKKEFLLKLIFILPVMGLCLLFSLNAMAQQTTPPQQQPVEDFKEEELKQFAHAAGKVMVIQQETEQKMMKVLEEENIEVDKFNEILMAQQSQDPELAASEEEMESFNKASEKMMEIQNEVQGEMVKAIQEEGLEPEKYEQIMLAYQSSPEVKAKIDALFQEQ